MGYNIDQNTSLFPGPFHLYMGIFYLLLFLGNLFIFYVLLLFLFKLVTRDTDNKYSVSNQVLDKWFGITFPSYCIVAGILVLFCSIYYFMFFPGVVTWDSYFQIEQGVGFRPLNDQNPFLHTIIQGTIIEIGSVLFGIIEAGIALFSLIQMICIACIVSFVIRYMAKSGIPIVTRLFVLLFYAVYPIIAVL